jgi:hypothetical protein
MKTKPTGKAKLEHENRIKLFVWGEHIKIQHEIGVKKTKETIEHQSLY